MRLLAPVTPLPRPVRWEEVCEYRGGRRGDRQCHAGHLLRAGHSVTLCARGRRLTELRDRGLILENAQTGKRISHQVHVVEAPDAGTPCDVVGWRCDAIKCWVPFRGWERASRCCVFRQRRGTRRNGQHDGEPRIVRVPGRGRSPPRRGRAVCPYPAAENDAGRHRPPAPPRVKALAKALRSAGFPVTISTDAEAWLTAHAAFVVPIQFALYRVDVEPQRLAADDALLTTMVRATRQAFRALQSAGNTQIPRNLRALYLLMPERFVARYWRTTLAGPAELWFAAHTRAAPEEMASSPPFDLP